MLIQSTSDEPQAKLLLVTYAVSFYIHIIASASCYFIFHNSLEMTEGTDTLCIKVYIG